MQLTSWSPNGSADIWLNPSLVISVRVLPEHGTNGAGYGAGKTEVRIACVGTTESYGEIVEESPSEVIQRVLSDMGWVTRRAMLFSPKVELEQ